MEVKKLAASLMSATATVFAARLARAEKDSVTVDACADEVFTAWRTMVDKINKSTDPGGPAGP